MPVEEEQLRSLLSGTAAGDREAFKTLYEATSPRILGLLVQLLKQRDDAEDALQDTYIKVWHRSGDYHAERGRVNTWLSSIARYHALDIL
ncbi:MAG: RNA polymerase subunit sigma-70, partial [Halioglobus sp.]|nr:RNA polymerase subunit sigma-70 [Halioglobus sp.]